MTRIAIVILFIASFSEGIAQEKQLWAKSFINQEMPEFTVEGWLTEAPDYEGKFVLIDFWATWCAPCRKAIPELNEISKEFAEDLVVIGISDEPREKIESMTEVEIDYFSAYDTQKTLNTIFQVKGIPHAVIVDPQGIIRWEGYPLLSGHELTQDVVRELIESYKKE
ncbi:MAG: TlpA family protein disulfide reductase [Bacteroidia bacterium]|nr:TlpA family protein disulfide reductase [Bacteroidia bacterium]NND24804.1 TlpA family protein disulfide reductase [Flavobacteriaceae bacterium]MBT8278611.1 TlpA family protein disulfide reductase [Bacteroidia bacterium]NNK61200.1 TlpA family protein disulfide reductase [Flavobacteriaceae bacterium]NNL33754.1 TlpA family protein disulfide reductase [Flavobacteriaceae bacterium]